MSLEPVQIALAVIYEAGRWLVSRRAEGRVYAGLWEFPGGHIRPGESPEAAAVREAVEETALEVEAMGSLGELGAGSPDHPVCLHLILCRPVRGVAVPSDPAVAEVCWVTGEELRVLAMPPANAEIVRIVLASETRVGALCGPGDKKGLEPEGPNRGLR